MAEEKYGLAIKSLTMEEVKEVCEKIREIEQRHPKETIFIWVQGLEDKSPEAAKEFIEKVFPSK